jgi:hypothetical protein
MKTTAVLAAAMLLAAASAEAQQLALQIQDGRVTLDAQNVPVRQILAEWARVGGAKVVNGEKVAGAPVTLQLRDVPERQALDTILRGVSGYMLAARPDGVSGVSAFDRIMILPTSAAPRNAPAPAITGFPARPYPQPAPADADEQIANFEPDPDAEDNDDPEDVAEGEEPPMQGLPPRFQRRANVFPNPMGRQPQPQPFIPPNVPGMPDVTGSEDLEEQHQEAQPPSPANPFGVPAGASATPGVISPVPQQPGQPTTIYPATRPPRPPQQNQQDQRDQQDEYER